MSIGSGGLGTFGVGSTFEGQEEFTGFRVFVGGMDLASFYLDGSLKVQDSLNTRNVCDFALKELRGVDPDLMLAVGKPVSVDKDATRIFAGTIERVSTNSPYESPTSFFSVRCVDHNQLADRRLVAFAFETPGQTAGDIVRSIHSLFLASEGVTLGDIQDGPPVTKAIFNYQTVAAALDELTKLTGGVFVWEIDYFKALHFYSRGTRTAPLTISDANPKYTRLSTNTNRSRYRNVQALRAGQETSDFRTQRFKGDGENRTYTLEFPVAEEPALEVNSVPVPASDVGIGGVDAEEGAEKKLWFWNKGKNEVSQNKDDAPLEATDLLEIQYKGLFPIVVQLEDDEEIAARATVEGGSGRYERVESDNRIDDSNLAIEKTQGLLDRFNTIPEFVSYQTFFGDDLAAGQLQSINLSIFGLDDDFLIESVQVRDIGNLNLEWSVKALDGSQFGSWLAFFKKLVEISTGDFSVRENEVFVRGVNKLDTVQASDTLLVEQSDTIQTFTNDVTSAFLVGSALCGLAHVQTPEKI